MSPRKLTDSDKREILKLYRQPEETTSTLATRYKVSSSTISRLLKSRLAEEEYEALIHQKRSSRTLGGNATLEEEALELEPEAELEFDREFDRESEAEPEPELEASNIDAERQIRKRPRTRFDPGVEIQPSEPHLPVDDVPSPAQSGIQEALEDTYSASIHAVDEMFGEGLSDLDEDDGDLEDTDEDDWEDDPVSESPTPAKPLVSTSRAKVQVLPLSEASIPKICYLVVDRAAELIARPLKEFSDLGRIPVEEVQQKTLPVFDNHRVARRFSNRTQRVIKIPDGRMLQKTCTQLKAKGITRLLIDGQVYSLS